MDKPNYEKANLNLRSRPRVARGASSPNNLFKAPSFKRGAVVKGKRQPQPDDHIINKSAIDTHMRTSASSSAIGFGPKTRSVVSIMAPTTTSTSSVNTTAKATTPSSHGSVASPVSTSSYNMTSNVKKNALPSKESSKAPTSENLKNDKFTISSDSKYRSRTKRSQSKLNNGKDPLPSPSSSTSLSHLRVESPEFQLLAKLFMPSKYLITNDRLSVRQLSSNLPILIDDSMPQLNLQIHLFLSTVVTRYISSWYLTKLNTTNYEFIHNVYHMLCDVVQNIARRVTYVMVGHAEGLLSFIDSLAGIINRHLKELVSDASSQYPLKIFEQFRLRSTRNVIDGPLLNDEQILQTYLENEHVVFNRSQNQNHIQQQQRVGNKTGLVATKDYYDDVDLDDDGTSSIEQSGYPNSYKASGSSDPAFDANHEFTSDSSVTMAADDTCADQPHLVYFRALIRNILQVTFETEQGQGIVPGPGNRGPTSSEITMNLVILLVSDLVLDKLFSSLSSPQFCLGSISKAVAAVSQAIDSSGAPKKLDQSKGSEQGQSLFVRLRSVLADAYTGAGRMKSVFSDAYTGALSLIVSGLSFISSQATGSLSGDSRSSERETFHIFDSHVVQLLLTVTDVVRRRPMLYHAIGVVKACVMSSQRVAGKLDSLIKAYVRRQILESGALQDESLAQMVNELRVDLFADDENDSAIREQSNEQIDESNDLSIQMLTDQIFDLIDKLPRLLPLSSSFPPAATNSPQAQSTSKLHELKARIRQFLVVFNYSAHNNDVNAVSESCDLNKLLVVECLDCIVATLYPELCDVSSSPKDRAV